MFNVLPEKLKKKIKSGYRLRLSIVIVLTIFIIQISFLVLIFPSWLSSLYKEREMLVQAENSNRATLDSNIETINSTIKAVNTRMMIINSAMKYPKVVPFIDSVLSEKSKSISINEIIYISSGENSGKIILAGTSASRDSLVLFVKKLEETKLFKKIDLPISNLTKVTNINFTIELIISTQ